MPKTLLYLIRASEALPKIQMNTIWLAEHLDAERGDYYVAAPPSEIRDPPRRRQKFQQMMSKLSDGDTLLVTRLDELGRNGDEIRETVKLLEWKNVHTRCLELGDHRAELTTIHGRVSVHGPLIMQTIAAVGRVDHDERARRRAARKKAKRKGRPPSLKTEHKRREAVERCLERGATVTAVAGAMGVSRPTIYRAFQAAFGPDYHAKLAVRRAAIARASTSLL